jgi:hypothetical protein
METVHGFSILSNGSLGNLFIRSGNEISNSAVLARDELDGENRTPPFKTENT